MTKSFKLKNSVYIDWQSIVAGGIALNSLFRAISLKNVDLDNYKTTGFYYFQTGCTNAPASYLYCLVFGRGAEPAIQLGFVMGGSDYRIYCRKYANSKWYDWVQITTS